MVCLQMASSSKSLIFQKALRSFLGALFIRVDNSSISEILIEYNYIRRHLCINLLVIVESNFFCTKLFISAFGGGVVKSAVTTTSMNSDFFL